MPALKETWIKHVSASNAAFALSCAMAVAGTVTISPVIVNALTGGETAKIIKECRQRECKPGEYKDIGDQERTMELSAIRDAGKYGVAGGLLFTLSLALKRKKPVQP